MRVVSLSVWMLLALVAGGPVPAFAQTDGASGHANLGTWAWADLDAFYAEQAEGATDSLLVWQATPSAAVREAGVRWLLTPGRIQLVGGSSKADTSTASLRLAPDFGEKDLRALWKAIDAFRAAHPAVAAGEHLPISLEPYAFHRQWRRGQKQDHVVVALGASGRTALNVSKAFADNAIVRNVLTGEVAFVSFGAVYFTPDATGILLLEEIK